MIKSYDEILNTMKQEFAQRAGFEADDASDIGIRLKVLASQIYSLWLQVGWLTRQAFPHTATGNELDMHAQMRGISRREATKAQGELTFSRETPLTHNVIIPAGTVCAAFDNPELRFITTQDAVLNKGITAVTAPAIAEKGGKEYNVIEGVIRQIVTPLDEIESVNNAEEFSGGFDAEDDESLRERILNCYGNILNGANIDFYKSCVMEFNGIKSANVVKWPLGYGSLDIFVQGTSGYVPHHLLNQISNKLNEIKEVSTIIRVFNANCTPFNLTARVYAKKTHNPDIVREEVKTAITNEIDKLKVGDPVYLNKIGKVILEVDGVADYVFVNAQNAPAQADNYYIPGVIEVTVEEEQ